MILRKKYSSCFILLALVGGCGECPAPQDKESGTRIRALNEMSPKQLRVWLKGFPGDWQSDTDKVRGLPEPPTAKAVPPDARRIDLAEPNWKMLGQRPLGETIVHRRSRREYSDAPFTLEELGFLLWSAQGLSAAGQGEDGTFKQLYRTAPSAGGRYPLETYVFVQRVEGLQAGLYRYLSAEHQLVLMQEASLQDALKKACYDAPAVENAAAVFAWAAVPYRTEWQYGYIAHRMIAMEAGHACQNLYLAAESIGGGACAMLAYDQVRMDQLTGVDGKEEFVIYLATVGKVKP